MIFILTAVFFTLGLIIGSFLNVVILRLNTARSLGGRSACMSCQRNLEWYELVPFVSFIALRGRCRSCKTKISIQYPLVELLAGALFALLYLRFSSLGGPALGGQVFFSFLLPYAYYALGFCLLLVIAVYDLRHKIIPDRLVAGFGVLSLAGLFVFVPAPGNTIFAGIFLALPFLCLWLLSRGAWIGLGDAKLVLGIGWFLGFAEALSAIMLAFWSGALIGVALIVYQRKSIGLKTEIPFAPFLVLGAFLAFIFSLHLFPSF